MELNLQPQAALCQVTGQPFAEGDRVASYLVRGAAMEIMRYDVLESAAGSFTPEGVVACRWVHAYKPRLPGENADRRLKLTAESLFLTLADPLTEPTEENTRLVRFLALMLERKKLLKARGRSVDGTKDRYEHAKTKQTFELPAGELNPAFFMAVQAQLGLLVGSPAVPATPTAAEAAPAVT